MRVLRNIAPQRQKILSRSRKTLEKYSLIVEVQLQQEVISCKGCISLQISLQLNKLSNHSK